MPNRRSADPLQLLANAREGDESSLGAIAELYTNYLKLLARGHVDRNLQRRLSPSDLVQETFPGRLRQARQYGMIGGVSSAACCGTARV
jgi:DNA-directed RNA polymerase specialized sigma24 family protein